LKKQIEAFVDSVLSKSPAQSLSSWKSARKLAVLAYHGVDDPAQFEKQMEVLARTMQPISLHQYTEAMAKQTPLPDRAVLVTFDDGARSILESGAPILKRYGIPAVAYVVAGVLDSNQPLWWNEVKELIRRGGSTEVVKADSPENIVRELKKVPDTRRLDAIAELRATSGVAASPARQLQRNELIELERSGIAVENHSMTHPIFPKCPEEKIREEILQAHAILTNALGHPPTTFAFPNGDADHRATSIFAELGYAAAFLFDHKISAHPPEDRYHISRVRVNSTTGLNRFRTILSGLHPALHQWRGRK